MNPEDIRLPDTFTRGAGLAERWIRKLLGGCNGPWKHSSNGKAYPFSISRINDINDPEGIIHSLNSQRSSPGMRNYY
jgi:hypothetical protein